MDNGLYAYYEIYDQLYENPFVPVKDIASKLEMSEADVNTCLDGMYQSTILLGPVISLKPASTYRRYCYFFKTNDPKSLYDSFHDSVVSKSRGVGGWNVMVVTDKERDSTVGKADCIHSGEKGGTTISRVTHLDWDHSLKDMFSVIGVPDTESISYEEGPPLNWSEKEWLLYHAFRLNARQTPDPVLTKLEIDVKTYQNWLSTLSTAAHVQPAFNSHGFSNCGMFDFLLKSQYQEQIITILGLFPCSCAFFSADNFLLVRFFLTWPGEAKKVDTLLWYLEKYGYCTSWLNSFILSTSPRNFDLDEVKPFIVR
ncbi:MAG: hypothetical protein HXS44_06880 [Theionarchaea archaeon]|nr:hypothetical protein [Theionarchaea archaeon]MBU7017216.1 hypothetical protein [Theionarchaea archaeon]